MNWFKKQIMEWALAEKKNEVRNKVQQMGALATTAEEVRRSDALEGCAQMRFTIINVENGTLVRMDTYRPEDEYTVRAGGPRRPPVFIVKEGETVQDVIVRQLGIAALERS